MEETALWLSHRFFVRPHDQADCDAVAGVYVFCGLNRQNQWHAYYIGKTGDLSSRLTDHPRWKEAARLGATHIHVLLVSEETERDSLESALIAKYQPPLNDQGK